MVNSRAIAAGIPVLQGGEDVKPGDRPLPAHTIAKDLRCNRAACKKLFDLADAVALNT